MANRWSDGFGRYGGDKTKMLNGSSSQAWAQVDAALSLSTANPRTGTHCLRLGDESFSISTNVARRVFGAPLEEVLVGFGLYALSLPTSETRARNVFIGSFRDQANVEQVRFVLGADGAIEARRNAISEDYVVLGRTVPVIGAGAYQHIEIYYKAGNSDGALEVRVDQVIRMNLTGIDTVHTANVEASQFAVGHIGAYVGEIYDFADVYCNDTEDDGSGCDTFIGDCKSGVLMVNADTAQADFDLSAGAVGYDLLDDRPPNDATYISTESETAESDFGFANAPANLTEILTARPFVRAWKDDAGTCEIAPSLISNGDKAVVDSQPIATAPSYYDSNVPLNPDTAAPWTLSELDAALEVVERTS